MSPNGKDPTDLEVGKFLERAVKVHGTKYVLDQLVFAADLVGHRLEYRGDRVGAKAVFAKNEILKRARREWKTNP